MLLPGPEAQQLAVYVGWLLLKTMGGLVAGTLFVLPGLVAIMALSLIYAAWGKVGIVAALFFGLKAAVLGGLLTTWVTFTPCFLWIFLGAPYIEALRSNRALSGALAAITAAVVGVILNLAVWFGLHVLFREVRELRFAGVLTLDVPVLSTVNVASLVLTAAAIVAMFRFKIGMIPVIAGCSIAGLLYGLAIGFT